MFKRQSIIFAFLFLNGIVFSAFFNQSFADGFNIKVKVKGFADTSCYLAYYYGSKILVSDTFKVDSKGTVVFKGEEKLPGGIYLAVYPGSKYFEFLVNTDQQNFSLETDTLDFIGNMKVNGSPDNSLFNEYQRFLTSRQKNLTALKSLKDKTENEDSIGILDNRMREIEKEIKEYRENITISYPSSFLAAIINSMWEPEVPETPKDEKGNPIDPQFPYKYFKAHFWDKFDFSDERLVRTPLFQNKINFYIENLTVKHPDSINVSADFIIDKAKANKNLFRYALSQIAYTYETSKIMGMDAVFVHLAQKYYLKGDAFWMDSTNMAKMNERVAKLKYNLLGLTAPELKMPDLNNNPFSLHAVKSDFTLLVFWDYNCGHCKKEMPELIKLNDHLKEKGLTTIGICTRVEIDEIKKFAEEYHLPWLNVYDPYNRTRFREMYDIYSTPTLYLLDKDKKIIAKRISPQQIEELINNLSGGKQNVPMKQDDDQ